MSERIDAAEARRQLLAKMLSGKAGGGAAVAAPDPVPPRDPGRPVPLTSEQSQLWLHAQMAPEMPLYNESITIHRLGPYDHVALERAMSEIVRRHAAWRTSFPVADGAPVQRVAAPRPQRLSLVDLAGLPR